MSDTRPLKLIVNVDQAQLIVNALEALPHIQVRQLIDSIMGQAKEQIKPATALPTPPLEEEVE